MIETQPRFKMSKLILVLANNLLTISNIRHIISVVLKILTAGLILYDNIMYQLPQNLVQYYIGHIGISTY